MAHYVTTVKASSQLENLVKDIGVVENRFSVVLLPLCLEVHKPSENHEDLSIWVKIVRRGTDSLYFVPLSIEDARWLSEELALAVNGCLDSDS